MRKFLQNLDTKIQAGVDQTAFFLMHHLGVNKAFLWYALSAMLVAILAALMILPNRDLLAKSGDGIFAAILFIEMHKNYHQNNRQNNSSNPLLSTTDVFFSRIATLVKMIVAFVLILALPPMIYRHLVVTISMPDAEEFLQLCFQLTYLTTAYLCKTPNRPPPRRERLTALVPIQVTTNS